MRDSSRGRAPRPRAAASAEAPASPTGILQSQRQVMAGSAPAPSPSASRWTPSGLVDLSLRCRRTSAGSTAPIVPSVVRSAAERPLLCRKTSLASRRSLQLRIPTLRHSAAATS
eukprot:scaffold35061_cov63-Phaeocystis_antarctica.AAC.2